MTRCISCARVPTVSAPIRFWYTGMGTYISELIRLLFTRRDVLREAENSDLQLFARCHDLVDFVVGLHALVLNSAAFDPLRLRDGG